MSKDVFVIRNGKAVPVEHDKQLVSGNNASVKWTNNAEKLMVQRVIDNHIRRAIITHIIRRGR